MPASKTLIFSLEAVNLDLRCQIEDLHEQLRQERVQTANKHDERIEIIKTALNESKARNKQLENEAAVMSRLLERQTSPETIATSIKDLEIELASQASSLEAKDHQLIGLSLENDHLQEQIRDMAERYHRKTRAMEDKHAKIIEDMTAKSKDFAVMIKEFAKVRKRQMLQYSERQGAQLSNGETLALRSGNEACHYGNGRIDALLLKYNLLKCQPNQYNNQSGVKEHDTDYKQLYKDQYSMSGPEFMGLHENHQAVLNMEATIRGSIPADQIATAKHCIEAMRGITKFKEAFAGLEPGDAPEIGIWKDGQHVREERSETLKSVRRAIENQRERTHGPRKNRAKTEATPVQCDLMNWRGAPSTSDPEVSRATLLDVCEPGSLPDQSEEDTNPEEESSAAFPDVFDLGILSDESEQESEEEEEN